MDELNENKLEHLIKTGVYYNDGTFDVVKIRPGTVLYYDDEESKRCNLTFPCNTASKQNIDANNDLYKTAMAERIDAQSHHYELLDKVIDMDSLELADTIPIEKTNVHVYKTFKPAKFILFNTCTIDKIGHSEYINEIEEKYEFSSIVKDITSMHENTRESFKTFFLTKTLKNNLNKIFSRYWPDYAGFCYKTLVFSHPILYVERNFQHPSDWQHNHAYYENKTEINKYLSQMMLYKTPDTLINCGDLLENLIWSVLYLEYFLLSLNNKGGKKLKAAVFIYHLGKILASNTKKMKGYIFAFDTEDTGSNCHKMFENHKSIPCYNDDNNTISIDKILYELNFNTQQNTYITRICRDIDKIDRLYKKYIDQELTTNEMLEIAEEIGIRGFASSNGVNDIYIDEGCFDNGVETYRKSPITPWDFCLTVLLGWVSIAMSNRPFMDDKLVNKKSHFIPQITNRPIVYPCDFANDYPHKKSFILKLLHYIDPAREATFPEFDIGATKIDEDENHTNKLWEEWDAEWEKLEAVFKQLNKERYHILTRIQPIEDKVDKSVTIAHHNKHVNDIDNYLRNSAL